MKIDNNKTEKNAIIATKTLANMPIERKGWFFISSTRVKTSNSGLIESSKREIIEETIYNQSQADGIIAAQKKFANGNKKYNTPDGINITDSTIKKTGKIKTLVVEKYENGFGIFPVCH